MKIYVPDTTNYKCFYVRSEGVIRAYKQNPTYNSNIEYRDYYINSNYIYTDGYQSFSQYSTLPVCLSSNDITTDFYYRNDIADILIIFVILSIFIIYLPCKIFSRFFGRWLKL